MNYRNEKAEPASPAKSMTPIAHKGGSLSMIPEKAPEHIG
jgi:hypothetical protein